jgi:hypothetical protein
VVENKVGKRRREEVKAEFRVLHNESLYKLQDLSDGQLRVKTHTSNGVKEKCIRNFECETSRKAATRKADSEI